MLNEILFYSEWVVILLAGSIALTFFIALIRVCCGWDATSKNDTNEKVRFNENVVAIKRNHENEKQVISNN